MQILVIIGSCIFG